MAAEEPFDAAHPPDEGWWTSELHRSEKAFDQFMASLGEAPDSMRLERFGLETGPLICHEPPSTVGSDNDNLDPSSDAEEERMFRQEIEEMAESELDQPDETDPDDDPEVNGDYPVIAKLAREFAVRVFDLENPPAHAEVLCLSAGKVGANLAGGHGLGYEDEFICGNIVKCRWALSDCEFCREMLEQWHEQTGDPVYGQLVADSRAIADAIRERIARLRQRVWW